MQKSEQSNKNITSSPASSVEVKPSRRSARRSNLPAGRKSVQSGNSGRLKGVLDVECFENPDRLSVEELKRLL